MKEITSKFKSLSIKKLLQSRLLNNMSWLMILNFSNSLIPFFTIPYITRIFSPEGYGQIAFALAFIAYFQTFIDYGFNLTGVRKISAVEKEIKEVSKIYSSILFTKSTFFLLSLPIIIIFPIIIPSLEEYKNLIYIFSFMTFSNVVIPIFIFQGLQKMKVFTLISLLIRVGFLIAVFTLINSIDDIYLYALIYSLSFILIGVVSMALIKIKLKIQILKVDFIDIKNMIVDGYHIFTSKAVIAVMGTTGIFVLGMFHTSTLTGYYSGLNKLNQVIIMTFYPIGQALFPYHSKKFNNSFKEGYRSTKMVAKLVIPLYLIFSLIIIGFRETIVKIFLGPSFVSVSSLLMLLGFYPLLSIISNFLGTQILVASGHNKEYSRAFLKGAIASIFLYILLGYYFSLWGVTIATFLSAVINIYFLFVETKKLTKKYL